jgi:hypothetical protein
MRYPDWAPPILKQRHRKLIEAQQTPTAFKGFGELFSEPGSSTVRPDTCTVRKRAGVNAQREEARLQRRNPVLPIAELAALQGRLITDQRMRPVWESLLEAGATDDHLVRFCRYVEDFLKEARGLPQLTPANRRDLLTDIGKRARELIKLIGWMPELDKFPDVPDGKPDPQVLAFDLFLGLMDKDRAAGKHLLSD